MPKLAATSPRPIRKAAQSLRWFVRAFEDQAARISEETGVAYQADHTDLARVFAEWRKAFDAQKPRDATDYPAYVGFAAGLVLRTLLQVKPVQVTGLPEGADTTNPAYYWPEGYLYVVFCLNVRGLVLETDFDGHQTPRTDLDDVRTWWSFRENVEEDSALAIAFLEHFAGEDAHWETPEIFHPDRTARIAGRFYAPNLHPLNGTVEDA
ncbi:hypothetical protein [Jannaschia aquimarina]|uniref:Uncharacterized protein n=1 Tax=Jannaschia aquimarina TaxID=935700 RepID=A0A0D1DBS7_9RHOB|nr:hypothetical protein [Jannaschia aquimarina]KIT17443.1 hypothetical protein jaqu_06310 [Jannaschia aquimarina]SNS75963.1 hypothetical protein SAMN05421775_102179 [Jannaschia aquimarina]